MHERADAVIVGGGILGCLTALHLLDRGVANVVILERDGIAQGTSHAGGGFVGRWGGGYIPDWGDQELMLEAYGIDFYRALAGDQRLEFGYKRNGNLWLATTPEAWDRHLEVIATHPGVANKQILTPEQVEEVTGIVPAAGVVGGVLHPDGCQVSAPAATAAIARRVQERGGRIRTRTPVTRLVIESGRAEAVETGEGTIAADVVVVAAGAWTNVLLRAVGAWMPMVPLIATRIITEPLGVPGTMPTLMLQEFSSIWLREEAGGLLWGCGYKDTRPRLDFVDEDPPERFDHLPLDGFFETQRIGAEAARAIPLLAEYRSPRIAQAAPTYTPDLRGIVCGVPDVDGLWVVGGDNEAGITHGPGYGRLLADLVCDGGTSAFVDPAAFSVARFGDRFSNAREVSEFASRPLSPPTAA